MKQHIGFHKSLNGRLLAALVLVTIISVSGVGLAAYLNERAALEEQMIVQLSSVADLKREQIVIWLEERQADARLLAINKLNQDHLSQILAPNVTDAHKADLTAFLTDNLIGLQQSRIGYSEIEFVDTHGQVVLATNPASIGQPTVHEVAFAAMMAEQQEAFIQDIHLNPHNGLIDMTFAHVIQAIDLETGQELAEPLGAVIIVVNADETVYPLIETWPGRGDTGETLLIRSEAAGTLFLNQLRFQDDAPLSVQVPFSQEHPMPAQLAAQGAIGVIQTEDYRGVPVLAVYRFIPQMKWGFVAKQDVEEAFRPINTLARRIGMVMAAVLLIASGVAIILSRTLTRPLAQLVAGTQAVAAGDLTIEFDVLRKDEVGQLTHAFNEMTNAVQRRESALQALTASLEQRVTERTADLQTANEQLELEIIERKQIEEALRQARDEALEASRLKTQLLANVSHDLRTPLNAIQGYTEMLHEGVYSPLAEQQKEVVVKIINSTGQIFSFVNNLIDQAQIEAGKLNLNMIDFYPRRLVDDVTSSLNVLAKAKSLALISQVNSAVPELLQGDPYWVRQILVNLVSNAIKFTKEGQVSIHIYRGDAQHWNIQVIDTGIGISAEAQSYIFEAFRQVDGTATRGHSGSGLGLSIVKELTLLMEGQITLESTTGEGSTFTISLPLVHAKEKVV